MRTKRYSLKYDDLVEIQPKCYQLSNPRYKAYGVRFLSIFVNGQNSHWPSQREEIEFDNMNGCLNFNFGYPIDSGDILNLELNFIDYRDRKFLFPNILTRNEKAAAKVAVFHREMDSSFNAGAIQSFLVMAGAIIEGILFFHLRMNNKANLSTLIEEAYQKKLISSTEHESMKNIKEFRNNIHIDDDNSEAIQDATLMVDTMVLIEKLIDMYG